MLMSAALLWSCQGPPSYPVTGEVVQLRTPTEIVIAHDEILGFMDAMTMPFTLAEPYPPTLDPGDKVAATLIVDGGRSALHDLRITAQAPPPPHPTEQPPALAAGEAVPEGALFPPTPVRLTSGSLTIGHGQGRPVAVTFLYTRCPLPEYCPLVVSRFQALQKVLPPRARLLAITLDPAHDTRSVLRAFGAASGAQPGRWDLGTVPPEVLFGLAEKAGLQVHGKGLGITHDLVLLILDAEGRLIRRYRDMAWDQAEVVRLLSAP